jgi:YD repeat-containing protein
MTGRRTGEQEETIWYYGDDQQFRVKFVKDSDESVTSYSYQLDPDDPLHRTTASVNINSSGEEMSRTKEEFFEKELPSGGRWLSRKVKVANRYHSSTEYDRPGYPLAIESNGLQTTFQYDGQGRVVQKAYYDGNVTELSYDDRHNKITRVIKHRASDPELQLVTTFRYDDTGNLLAAESSDGRKVELLYNPENLIKVLNISGKVVQLEYNGMKKPVHIAIEGMGELRITYHADGVIDKVDSGDSSTSLSLTVVSAFQDLLDLVKEASVNFSISY